MAATPGPPQARRRKRGVGALIVQIATVIAAVGVILGIVWTAASLYHEFRALQRQGEALRKSVEGLENQVRCLEDQLTRQQRSRWGMRARSEELAAAVAEGRSIGEVMGEFWDAQLQAECTDSGGNIDLSALSCTGAHRCVEP